MTDSSSYRRRTSLAGLVFGLAVGLLLDAGPAWAQETGTIEGQVRAAHSGVPLSGVQVAILRHEIGTTTGQDGRFVLLNVPAGRHVIRAVAIGYKVGVLELTVPTGQVASADIELSRSVLELDAVVVTGTAGQARVREVGNSIGQIDLTRDVKDPPASLDHLLQGRVVGLNVMQGNGAAGAGAQIRLRGAVSVSQSNQPLIYIDGVRVRSEGYRRNGPPAEADFTGRGGNVQASPLNDINPAEIERIEVIKGSAASTLYGTEAAAGVIQIFTRKGSRGTPRWNVQIDQGFSNLRSFGTEEDPYLRLRPKDDVGGFCPDVVADTLEWARAYAAAGGADGDPSTTADNQARISAAPTPGACSWLRNGYRQKYSGSVAGGFEDFQYFVSGSFEDNDFVLPGDNAQKLVTRGNFTFNVMDNLRVDWNTSYTNLDVSNAPVGNNAQGLTLNIFRAERNYRSTNNPIQMDSLLGQSITTGIDRLITGGTVYYTPWTWFNNRFTVGYDLAQQENRNLRPFGFVSQPEGRLFDEQNQYTTLTADYVGNMDYRLTGEFGGTFSFGGQSVTIEEVRTFAWGRGFPGPGEPTVSNASEFISQEDRIRVVNAGFFFQNVFKFRDRWFLTGGIRFDGNSAFGENLGLEAYPKASLSYVLSDEPWFPDVGEVKLRGALGWSGRAPGAFDAARTWEALPFAGQPAFLPENVGNPNLGPERTREIEFGLDGAFLNGRLSTEFTWYHQRTADALLAVRQVPSLGFLASQLANVGAIRNTGIEGSVNATIIDSPNWGFDVGTSIYTNKSLVLELGDAAPFAGPGDTGGWVEEGFPVMAANGVIIKNENDIAAPDTLCIVGTDPCNVNGRYMFGPQQPEVIWGMHGTIRFPKGITLSARGEYQAGAWIFDNATNQALIRSVIWPTCAAAEAKLTGVDRTNRAAVLQRVNETFTARERIECDIPIKNQNVLWFPQDFFKVRDVTLTVPLGSLIPRTESATLSITAQNFIRWINSDLRMFDPEMTPRDNLDEQNREISEHIPPPAIFTASLRVTF